MTHALENAPGYHEQDPDEYFRRLLGIQATEATVAIEAGGQPAIPVQPDVRSRERQPATRQHIDKYSAKSKESGLPPHIAEEIPKPYGKRYYLNGLHRGIRLRQHK